MSGVKAKKQQQSPSKRKPRGSKLQTMAECEAPRAPLAASRAHSCANYKTVAVALVCVALLCATVVLSSNNSSSSRSSGSSVAADDDGVVPWRALPETHALRRKLQRHAVLTTMMTTSGESLATQQAPFSVLWRIGGANNDAAMQELVAAFGDERVVRVHACTTDGGSTAEAVRARVEQLREPALVLFERACADEACQDALTVLLDESVAQTRRSVRAAYVLLGCDDAAMADRLRHRVKHECC
jgi:hypothetical protein